MSRKILVVEDSMLMRLQLKKQLELKGFDVQELDGMEDYFSSRWRYQDIDLMLLDICLPGIDGISALKMMQEDREGGHPPVFIMSVSADRDTIRKVLAYGARDYLLKPFPIDDLCSKIEKLQQSEMADFYLAHGRLVKKLIRLYESYMEDPRLELYTEKIGVLADACMALGEGEEKRILFKRNHQPENYTFRHSVNVAMLAGVIGKWIGIEEPERRELVISGLLHDCGKMKVDRNLLTKTDRLSETEHVFLKRHPEYGRDVVKNAGLSHAIIQGIYQHHEKIDGSGYPQHLTGREMHLFAKIIAVADTYDAMTSNRCYHSEDNPFAVMEVLFQEMFGKMDSYICSVFMMNVKRMMVGGRVRMIDGTIYKLEAFGGEGFAEPILNDCTGSLKMFQPEAVEKFLMG